MASMTLPASNPPTQIFYLTIPPEKNLDTESAWQKAIDSIAKSPGFVRCYWGRSLETPEKVQLHIGKNESIPTHSLPDVFLFSVRATLSQHQNFLYAHDLDQLLETFSPLTGNTTRPLIRHAHLHKFTDKSALVAPFPKFVGSAIYVSTTPTWHEGSWPLWTHIVRYVKGNNGIVGGSVEEPVDGRRNSYLVYVGWDSVEEHEEYHHTEHFAKRRIVLGLGNEGYREYGHVVFTGWRDAKGKGKL
jgi:heme-degrading monooxygenase HmoA